MPFLSFGVLVAAGISLFSGLYHLLYYLGTGRRRTDLAFALACFLSGGYCLATAGLYGLDDFHGAPVWHRWQAVTISGFALAFLWFTRELTGKTVRLLDRAFTGFFLAWMAFILLAPASWLWSGRPAVKEFLLFGRLSVVYNEMEGTALSDSFPFAGLLLAGYVLLALFRAYRGGERRMVLPILVGTGLMGAAALNDALVAMRAYPFIYLMEYAFVSLILAMVLSLGVAHRSIAAALRDSLREKEVLLQEIHHRVKNNLQCISGLLDLQSHHIADPAYRSIYRESQNRVITMALIHEQLYQSQDLARVDFSLYLRNLVENLLASYGAKERVRVDLAAEPVDLVVDTAIPCGLIANELVSNALKHAFPGGRRGTLHIGFTRGKDGIYLLRVADDGVGLPRELDISRSPSLGLKLVSVILEQLKGTIEVGREGGASFLVAFGEYREAGTAMF